MSIDPAALAHRVRSRRLAQRQKLREAAKEAGLSPATMSRVERGDYVPGRENLIKLASWLGVPLDEFLPDAELSGHRGEPETTLEAVALHLRADKNLGPNDAEVLEKVFRSAYEALLMRKSIEHR